MNRTASTAASQRVDRTRQANREVARPTPRKPVAAGAAAARNAPGDRRAQARPGTTSQLGLATPTRPLRDPGRSGHQEETAVLPEARRAIADTGTSAGAPDRIGGLAKATKDILTNAERPEGETSSRTTGAYRGGLGILGLAGGGLQAASGARALLNGGPLDGAPDAIAGGLNATSAAAGVSKKAEGLVARGLQAIGGARSLGAAASKVPVAGPLAGAAGAITGSVEVVSGIKDGKPGKAALGGAKAIGGSLLVASAFAGPAAPVLAAAGGAVLLGVTAWEYRKPIAQAASWVAHRAADGARCVAEGAAGAAKSVAEGAAGAAKSAIGGAADAIGGLF